MLDQQFFTEQQALEALYQGRSITNYAWQNSQQHNIWADILNIPPVLEQQLFSTQWILPEPYASCDVEKHVWSLCPQNDQSRIRVQQELQEFQTRNLYDMLRAMIYIVDTMRKHNVVWGVGRGSSVASYVLYLLGVHRIDSLKYQLNLMEFFK